MEFKGTKGRWQVKHSESKTAFNVVGTVLGGRYKIARCPYLQSEKLVDITNSLEKKEAKANARLIAAAPELLDACIEALKFVDVEEPAFDVLQAAINKAIGIE